MIINYFLLLWLLVSVYVAYATEWVGRKTGCYSTLFWPCSVAAHCFFQASIMNFLLLLILITHPAGSWLSLLDSHNSHFLVLSFFYNFIPLVSVSSPVPKTFFQKPGSLITLTRCLDYTVFCQPQSSLEPASLSDPILIFSLTPSLTQLSILITLPSQNPSYISSFLITLISSSVFFFILIFSFTLPSPCLLRRILTLSSSNQLLTYSSCSCLLKGFLFFLFFYSSPFFLSLSLILICFVFRPPGLRLENQGEAIGPKFVNLGMLHDSTICLSGNITTKTELCAPLMLCFTSCMPWHKGNCGLNSLSHFFVIIVDLDTFSKQFFKRNVSTRARLLVLPIKTHLNADLFRFKKKTHKQFQKTQINISLQHIDKDEFYHKLWCLIHYHLSITGFCPPNRYFVDTSSTRPIQSHLSTVVSTLDMEIRDLGLISTGHIFFSDCHTNTQAHAIVIHVRDIRKFDAAAPYLLSENTMNNFPAAIFGPPTRMTCATIFEMNLLVFIFQLLSMRLIDCRLELTLSLKQISRNLIIYCWVGNAMISEN
ncbi:putative signal peptide protein [Puccinia sorghi]|uniref:Putative signal peptide protein n=1 Tax=Puccinia sorghi TaxID=27349 RepID=A0A0L6UZV4_9BASI|nr:putative signal peptide protein [Puccinia sorghi]